MTDTRQFFATCPKGIESLLADELRQLDAETVKETRAGVAFEGPLAIGYRACLWSRLASRILLPLTSFPAPTPEDLYAGVKTIAWKEHLDAEGTLAVDFTTSQSAITHSHYGALKAKDAVVDQLRDEFGVRPSVDTAQPDVRINIYLLRDQATVSLDLSGESLHRRGYRTQTVQAPLKENLAAAILLRAHWPAIAKQGGMLVDLMCGSGTLLIEGAMIATDMAPGLAREYFGFLRWKKHDAAAWAKLLDEAHQRRETGLAQLPPIHGYDHDPLAIRAARDNIKRAGLGNLIVAQQRELSDCSPEEASTGLVVANPPYGERLGPGSELSALYTELGTQFKKCFPGWRGAVFTGNPELGKVMGLRAGKMHTLYNGAIECKLLHFEITPENVVGERVAKPFEIRPGSSAEMFANRLRKDLQHFGRWARRQEIFAYRLYDADLHEYNLAVDVYECDKRYVHVQEYEAPDTISPDKARQRLQHALGVIPLILEIPREQMFFKVRRRQKGGAQYEKLDETGKFHEVREGPCRFLVNFTDYLDTGLFLDHRDTRAMLGELAGGKRFLNLFGYTGTATVHAALGGAASTTTVDMSYTYLDWAQRNFDLNKLAGNKHELVQADVLVWLKENRQRRYELIFLDPPTFSRSKRMEDTLDILRDHAALITDTAALLEPGGILIFSTNLRRFRLDRDPPADLHIEDISRKTIPMDFERDPKIHQCFRITRK
ncbi:MAG: bifunctional 23S rRNA (guanine(2069)-N(7))-methyltransferase RlmK/23S rRNA (guanine(2445)-N(2))-methyltransferase RlmL [Sulfuricaulis sp.]|uniref:bifunctional 23S rRNA (guanine(2069)-N(7))-methyltransferase RlmK/23S rRNA (guanine(2445)-N(2))-methyltransferase RlmL n=1 Tax=Sulfuricaulis sp. TaxID=2003553 RepID=UPI0025D3AC18|nr:bifunctional 23S rRNA (guanine(2069)-N(7))-methyltransferase RlmK/23S rRNA (guanine(2445)-N(2))-methyltransferase RlmL [Sulfuricaulis sp.]MCR4346905.1 bifunctional 23S rRNA (guanine(2069)-N(7))-methyltransferase RlmK/23S rRNA (guanine(2445)-N(2))-methyltransferase RlmL [Sulfuricaulis sp.]